MPPETALKGVLPPLLIAAAFLLAGWRPWRRGAAPRRGHIWSAAALAVAYAITDRLVGGQWPGWPPAEERLWIPILGAGAAVGAALGIGRFGGRMAFVPVLALAGACFYLELRDRGPWIIAGCAAAATLVERGIALAAARDRGSARVAPAMIVAATATAAVCVQSSMGLASQMAGAVAAASGVFLAIAWWRRDLEVVRGAAAVFPVLLIGLLMSNTSVTWASRGLGVASMLAPWLVLPRPIAARQWLIGAGACGLVAAAFGALAVWQSANGLDFSGL